MILRLADGVVSMQAEWLQSPAVELLSESGFTGLRIFKILKMKARKPVNPFILIILILTLLCKGPAVIPAKAGIQ